MAFGSTSSIVLEFGNETSQSSLTSGTATGSVTAGTNVVIVMIAIDNISTTDGNTNNVTGFSDSAGNTYTKIYEQTNTVGGVAADGATVAAYYSAITNNITSGSTTFTINFSGNVTAKAIQVRSVTKDSGTTIAVDGTVQALNNDNADVGSLSTSGLQNIEHLHIHVVASETDTNTYGAGGTGTFTLMSTTSSGTGGSEKGHVSLSCCRKVSTSTGETLDATMTDTTADRAALLFALYQLTATPSYIGGTGIKWLGVGSLAD